MSQRVKLDFGIKYLVAIGWYSRYFTSTTYIQGIEKARDGGCSERDPVGGENHDLRSIYAVRRFHATGGGGRGQGGHVGVCCCLVLVVRRGGQDW